MNPIKTIKTIANHLAVLTGAVALCAAATSHAQVLKCIGKDGRIEFASSCPSGTKQMDTGVPNKPSAPATVGKGGAPASKSLAERDAEFRKRQTDQQKSAATAAQEKQDQEDRQRACQSAQSNLQAIKSRQRMFRIDPKTGERAVYEDADYARDQAISERQVAQHCS